MNTTFSLYFSTVLLTSIWLAADNEAYLDFEKKTRTDQGKHSDQNS